MKKTLFVVMLSCLSSTLFGQLTTTSSRMTDSTKAVETFYANAPAILDSLTRFSFVKADNKKLVSELGTWKSNYFQLSSQTKDCFTVELKYLAQINTITQDKTIAITKASRRGFENWIWRLGAVATILKVAKVW